MCDSSVGECCVCVCGCVCDVSLILLSSHGSGNCFVPFTPNAAINIESRPNAKLETGHRDRDRDGDGDGDRESRTQEHTQASVQLGPNGAE